MWPSGLTLAMTLTLNFQGQIWNFLYLSQKWSDCHETKSKHIDWTLGLKCDHWVWPWPWPWPWIFKVKYGISYISAKSGPIAKKRKANISIELQASNVTNGMDLPDSDWGDFSCRRAVDSSSLKCISQKMFLNLPGPNELNLIMQQGDYIDFQLELVLFIPYSSPFIHDVVVHIEADVALKQKTSCRRVNLFS